MLAPEPKESPCALPPPWSPLRCLPLGANAERQLRLLNGVYAGGAIAPGRAVKVIEQAALALQLARASLVLLKNADAGAGPLAPPAACGTHDTPSSRLYE
mgnify:CR=1 FL=1